MKNSDVRKEFDYNDLDGVIDYWDNTYDHTIPILVRDLSIIKLEKGVEILDGKCSSCGLNNLIVLKIDPIQNYQKYANKKALEYRESHFRKEVYNIEN